jgi:hypothetical protein
MSDLSWIQPLFEKARGAFGLDPKAAGEGRLMQKHGDLYDAQTETEKYRLTKLLPSQKGVFDADAGHKTALGVKVGEETRGIKAKNDAAQKLGELLADPTNYVTTADGRRVPDVNKIHGIIAASAGAGGEAGVKNVPGIIGGFNLQANPLSPGANLAAGGTNATAGASMLKPIQLNPDQTLIQKDVLTGQPITGVPAATPKVTMPTFGGQVMPGTLGAGAQIIPRGNISDADLAAILAPGNKAGMDKVGIEMPQRVNSNLPYTAPASSTKLQVADKNNEADLTQALLDNQTKLDIAMGRNATAKEIAEIRKEGQEIVARIRGGKKGSSASAGGGLGDGSEAVDPLSLNRLGEREKDAILAITNGFGKSGHEINANQAALLAAAATTSFPNDPAHVAVQKFMAQNGITSDTGGWSRVDFKNADGSPVDFNALRQKLFGAKPAAAGPAASATGAPATPAVGGGAAATPGSSVAGVVAEGAAPAGSPSGGVKIEGIPFEPDKVISKERSHGDKYAGIDKRTGKLTTAYWDAEALNGKGAWSDTPIGGRQEDFDKVNQLGKDLNREGGMFTRAPGEEESRTAEDELLKIALEKGAISKEEYDAVTKFGQVSGSKRSTAQKVVAKLKAMEGEEAKRDPRVKSYAKGDFVDDTGLPDNAMELAERLGIDREAYGIPSYKGKMTTDSRGRRYHESTLGDLGEAFIQNVPGSFFLPGYKDTQDRMHSGLKAFFSDVLAGKVKTSPKPRNDVPPASGPTGAKTEKAPELPAETKIEPPSIPKGVPTQTKQESVPVEKAKPDTKPAPKTVAEVVAPKKDLTDEEKRILSGKGFGKAQRDEVAAKQKK